MVPCGPSRPPWGSPWPPGAVPSGVGGGWRGGTARSWASDSGRPETSAAGCSAEGIESLASAWLVGSVGGAGGCSTGVWSPAIPWSAFGPPTSAWTTSLGSAVCLPVPRASRVSVAPRAWRFLFMDIITGSFGTNDSRPETLGPSGADFSKGAGLKWVRRKDLIRTFFQFELKRQGSLSNVFDKPVYLTSRPPHHARRRGERWPFRGGPSRNGHRREAG
jgi:hypothetical protein